MTQIAISGYSDDIVSIEINGKDFDEEREPNEFIFSSDGKALHANIAHGRHGWEITTRIEDESEEGDLPFKVAIVQEKYSPKLVIDFSTPLTMNWKSEGELKVKTFRV